MADDDLQPPPEAVVIRLARLAKGLSPEEAAARTSIRLRGGRWRQIEKGYERRDPPKSTRALDKTLAHMAFVVDVTPSQLDECGRTDAAEILRVMLQQESRAATEPDLNNRMERAAWEAPIPEDARREMIRLLRKGQEREREEREGGRRLA